MFLKGSSPTLRFVVLAIAAIGLMIADHRFSYLYTVRFYLSVLVYPIQYVVDFSVKASQTLSQSFSDRQQLLEENTRLREENLQLQFGLQKFADVKSENDQLRQLLNASKTIRERTLVAGVLAVDVSDPHTRKVSINKGLRDGIFDGQPVLDAKGVLGKVINVKPFNSTVLLITDLEHYLPVQIVRTGLRTVVQGTGASNRLTLLYLPNNANVVVGDLLVTSGLEGQLPAGYPVGTISEFNPDIGQSYARAQATPSAQLERNREVLLVWTEKPLSEIDSKLAPKTELIAR